MPTVAPRPVCFMIMPFGIKPVEPPVPGAPDKIDFDSLWSAALEPLIRELGYEPVRADQDTGAAIILEMLERLYFSDLVMADMTLPNGNVYYEVGIRHACKPQGCVLISADWARPLFDTQQMRRLVYPMAEGSVTAAAAQAIQDALRDGTRALATGTSPMYQHLPGFPDKVDPQRASVIRGQLDALSAFQARVRGVRLERDPAQRKAAALALSSEVSAQAATSATSAAVALDVLSLLRDAAGWQDALDYVQGLPHNISSLDAVQEQRCLALSKAGDHFQAIAALEELITRRGPSAERHGLIGGRYKKLAAQARQAGQAADAQDHLDQAIAAYESGMLCDLNDYFPSCNLPGLYRERGEPEDAQRALAAANVAQLACQRAKAKGSKDEWLNPTLLTLAFQSADLSAATQLAKEVRREGPAQWKLDTTLVELERSLGQMQGAASEGEFAALLAGLKGLVGR